MTLAADTLCTAFAGQQLIASGPLADVALKVKAAADAGETATILVFEDETGQQVPLDLRGSPDEVSARLVGAAPSPPLTEAPRVGRPKLGVTAREVTLLPRHWEWLAEQPGGASAALRRLVEEARRTHAGRDAARRAQEAAHRVMSALAGDLPDYEEALRALYAGDAEAFATRIADWPARVKHYVGRLAARAREQTAEA